MNKLWYIFLVICFLPNVVNGQNDYFIMNNVTTAGVKLINGGSKANSRFCQILNRDHIVKYSPYEVDEFGFKDGRVYLSREVQILDSLQKVFVERLNRGKITLLFYDGKGVKTFFFEKDRNIITEIAKNNKDDISYNEQLLSITYDCQKVADATKFVKYNKRSLSKLITRYNDCELKPFPHFRYGAIFGYELAKLVPKADRKGLKINLFDYKYDGGFTFGFFADKPILLSNFSLHSEINYSRHGFSYYNSIDTIDINFVANISSLKLPLLVRFAYPSNKFRPFINLGVVVIYNFSNENSIYETTLSENIIEINVVNESSLIAVNQAGYSIGGGIEYNLNYKYSVFFEMRYNKYYSLSDPKYLDITEFKFLTGINF